MKPQFFKKAILLALLVVPAISFASIDVDLRYGSQGQEVTELQEFLSDQGFLKSMPSGNFYSLTRSAVIAYQGTVGLPATGFVGPMTRSKINDELARNTSSEEAQSTPVVSVSSDTSLLKSQLDALIAQVSALIAEQKSATNQSMQTTQAVQQIAQNTTPVVSSVGGTTIVPDPVVVVSKKLNIYQYNGGMEDGVMINHLGFEIRYSENGKILKDVAVTCTRSDTQESFIHITGGQDIQGNPTTGCGWGGFDPKSIDTDFIISANGLSKTFHISSTTIGNIINNVPYTVVN